MKMSCTAFLCTPMPSCVPVLARLFPHHIHRCQLSGFSKVLAGGEEGGLREDDVRAIMSMMSSSDLNDLEDEVKSIQRDFRKWVYRCQYKSLRQASKTLDSSKAAQAAAKTLQVKG